MDLCVLLFLVVIPVSLAQDDLDSKVFVFPKESDTAHVILTPTFARSLEKVSVCLNFYTDLERPYSLFSLATSKSDNAFLIFSETPTIYSTSINNEEKLIKTDPVLLDWMHTCVTWDSSTGVIQLWVNGKLYPRKVFMKGSSIAAEYIIILGQDQDSYGGKFQASQSFVGEISDVHMWDDVLTAGDIQKAFSGDLHGNVIDWKSLRYEMKGDVYVQPKLQCRSWGSINSLFAPCV